MKTGFLFLQQLLSGTGTQIHLLLPETCPESERLSGTPP